MVANTTAAIIARHATVAAGGGSSRALAGGNPVGGDTEHRWCWGLCQGNFGDGASGRPSIRCSRANGGFVGPSLNVESQLVRGRSHHRHGGVDEECQHKKSIVAVTGVGALVGEDNVEFCIVQRLTQSA